MQEPYRKGVANHPDPEFCGGQTFLPAAAAYCFNLKRTPEALRGLPYRVHEDGFIVPPRLSFSLAALLDLWPARALGRSLPTNSTTKRECAWPRVSRSSPATAPYTSPPIPSWGACPEILVCFEPLPSLFSHGMALQLLRVFFRILRERRPNFRVGSSFC
jgi:hypothetical protein